MDFGFDISPGFWFCGLPGFWAKFPQAKNVQHERFGGFKMAAGNESGSETSFG